MAPEGVISSFEHNNLMKRQTEKRISYLISYRRTMVAWKPSTSVRSYENAAAPPEWETRETGMPTR